MTPGQSVVVWSLVLTVPSGSTVSVGVWFVWLGCGVVVLPCACTCVMFEQVPLRPGRQLMQSLPSFTQAAAVTLTARRHGVWKARLSLS